MGLLALALDLASVPLFAWFLVWQLGAGDVHGAWIGVPLVVLVCGLELFQTSVIGPEPRTIGKSNKEEKKEKRQARNNEPWWLKNLPLTVLLATAVVFILSLSL